MNHGSKPSSDTGRHAMTLSENCIQTGEHLWPRSGPEWQKCCPHSYHPDVHRELLRAAGANPDVVDEILMGFAIRGLNFTSGFYDSLPSISEEEREEMDLELERSLHHGPTEALRLLDRGSPGEGQ